MIDTLPLGCDAPIAVELGSTGDTMVLSCRDSCNVVLVDLITASGTPELIKSFPYPQACDLEIDTDTYLADTGFLYVPFNGGYVSAIDVPMEQLAIDEAFIGQAFPPNARDIEPMSAAGELGVLYSAQWFAGSLNVIHVDEPRHEVDIVGVIDFDSFIYEGSAGSFYNPSYASDISTSSVLPGEEQRELAVAFRGSGCTESSESDPDFAAMEASVDVMNQGVLFGDEMDALFEDTTGPDRVYSVDHHRTSDWDGLALAAWADTFYDYDSNSQSCTDVGYVLLMERDPMYGPYGYLWWQLWEMQQVEQMDLGTHPKKVMMTEDGAYCFVITDSDVDASHHVHYIDMHDALASPVGNIEFDPFTNKWQVTEDLETTYFGISTSGHSTDIAVTPAVSMLHPRPGSGLIGTVSFLLSLQDEDAVDLDLVLEDSSGALQTLYSHDEATLGLVPGLQFLDQLLDAQDDSLVADGEHVRICAEIEQFNGTIYESCWPYVVERP